VRSERAFAEEPDFQLLWRWFLDVSLMEPSFDQSTFGKNRGRLLKKQWRCSSWVRSVEL
jgi:hypothetical protein